MTGRSGEDAVREALADIRQERQEQAQMLAAWHQFREGVYLEPPDVHCTHWFGGEPCHLCGDDAQPGSEGPCDRSLMIVGTRHIGSNRRGDPIQPAG